MFTKKRILALTLAACMSVSLVLTSCTKVGSDTQSSSAYKGTAGANSVVFNLGSEPPKMFSTLTTDTTSMDMLRHLCDGLTALDKDDKVIPAVAKDWKISDDQLVFTFNLREDYKWTNGEKVTAHDFVFTYTSLLSAEFAAPYSYLGWSFKNGMKFQESDAFMALDEAGKKEYLEKHDNKAPEEVKADQLGVKALDDYTLEITLEQPTPYILDLLAFGVLLPINEKAYKEFGDAYGTDVDKIVTNGAFKLESWQHESEMVLVKNPEYAKKDEIKLEKITAKMISDTNSALSSFKSNEIDLINLNSQQLAQMKTEGQQTLSFDDGGSWYFEFNTEDKLLANKKIRQALTIAVDTESFVKNLVGNDSVAATRFTSPVIQGNKKTFYEEVGPQFSYDIEKAKTLLAEGMKEVGVDKVEVTMLIDDGDTSAKYAAFLQETWKKDLGVEAKIDVQVFKSRIAKMQAKDFQIVFAGWGPDYNDPMTFLDMFETGNGNNHTSYANPVYDELLAKVRVEADRDIRFGYLMDLEKILMDDLPVGTVFFRTRDYVMSSKLDGVIRTAFQNFNFKWASTK